MIWIFLWRIDFLRLPIRHQVQLFWVKAGIVSRQVSRNRKGGEVDGYTYHAPGAIQTQVSRILQAFFYVKEP